MSQQEKEIDTSKFWFIILPVMIVSILLFGFFVLFRVSSSQTVNFTKLQQLIKSYNSQK